MPEVAGGGVCISKPRVADEPGAGRSVADAEAKQARTKARADDSMRSPQAEEKAADRSSAEESAEGAQRAQANEAEADSVDTSPEQTAMLGRLGLNRVEVSHLDRPGLLFGGSAPCTDTAFCAPGDGRAQKRHGGLDRYPHAYARGRL